jgi:hypothetical protein
LPDELHPLQRDRQILLEALRQVMFLSQSYRERNLDAMPFALEAMRLSERLKKVQRQIEKLDLD